MSFDKCLLAVDSCHLSQADKSIISVSPLPKLFLNHKIYSCTKKKVFCTWQFVKIGVLVNLIIQKFARLKLVLLLISNLTNGLRLHQFLVTKSGETNKFVKTDANGAH